MATVYYKPTDKLTPEPRRAHPGDAGVDLTFHSLKQDDTETMPSTVTIAPGETVAIGTGIIAAIPRGYAGHLYVRSSLGAHQQITLANGTGIIDSQYRGEIIAVLQNNGKKAQTITYGTRIVQLVVSPVHLTPWEHNPEKVDQPTERGTGGYGSTGA